MTPRRILVISEGQLGDLILLTPALRGLKGTFPQAHLAVCVIQRREYGGAGEDPPLIRESSLSGTAAMLERLPYVDRVIEVSRPALRGSRGSARLRAEVAIIRRLRKERVDTAIACFPEDRFALWSRLCGARVRVGEDGHPFDWLFSRRLRMTKETAGVLKYYAALATTAGATVGDERTEVVVTADERKGALMLLSSLGLDHTRRYAVVHPGASGRYCVWPPERFAGAMEFLERKGVVPILCGTPFDEPAIGEITAHLPRTPLIVRLRGTVGETAALLSGASLVLSNDSGPRHLAVALGVPSVAIMPKHKAPAWRIYGPEHRAAALTARTDCPACPPDRCLDRLPEGEEFGSWCLRLVTLDEVCAAMEAGLSGG